MALPIFDIPARAPIPTVDLTTGVMPPQGPLMPPAVPLSAALGPLAPAPAPSGPSVIDPMAAALLQAGLAGMAASGPSRTPVSLGQIFGQAGMSGLQAFNTLTQQQRDEERKAKEVEEVKKLRDAQIGRLTAEEEERRRKADLERQQREWLSSPQVQEALAKGDLRVLAQMPGITAGELARMEGVLKPPAPKNAQVVEIGVPGGKFQKAVLGEDGSVKQLVGEPYEKRPGVELTLTPPIQGVNDKGEPIFFQVPKTGGQPRPLEGVYPPDRPSAVRQRQEQQAAEATVESVRSRIRALQDALQNESFIVGPAGAVRRGVETVGGVLAPGMETPAIDYQNNIRLLLADVRKIVEKDPNLSNQERQNLYETLGGGTFQTPGSAFRALTNILDYVESKKVSGPSRGARVESQIEAGAKAAWGAYEPDKYDYRIMNGQLQRKPKGK